MYTITARMLKGKEVIGYEVEGEDGKKSIWNKSEVLNLARNKDITNARVCQIKGEETLRGKDITLKSLPSIIVKDSLNETTSNPIEDKIWYQQAVQQIKNHDAVKISINMGESNIPTYTNGCIEYKIVDPNNITVHDYDVENDYDVAGQYKCGASLSKFESVDKANIIKILVPLISTVIGVFRTINQREEFKSCELTNRIPYKRNTVWKLNCLNDCTYTLNFACIRSCNDDITLISTDKPIQPCSWMVNVDISEYLNTIPSYIRFPEKNVSNSMNMFIRMYKHYLNDFLYSISIVWRAIIVKREKKIDYINDNNAVETDSGMVTMEKLIYWLETKATQLAVNAFYEVVDKL